MRDGICPKCQSEEVYNDEKSEKREMGYIKKGHGIYVNLVCVQCGYAERYLLSREKLVAISRDWSHHSPKSPLKMPGVDVVLDKDRTAQRQTAGLVLLAFLFLPFLLAGISICWLISLNHNTVSNF